LIYACFAVGVRAEKTAHWQIFRASDGLKDSHAVAITLSQRGNVWVKHADADEISVFDGYTFRSLASPGRDSFRVYESRTGRQLWSLSTNGLIMYDGKQWGHHPVPEIRAEIQSDVLRQIRQIPLLPVFQGRTLFLLSTRLMEYDATRRETTEIKHVSETGLGKFLEMAEARDGGVWITGAHGLAKISGPLRQINRDSVWQTQIIGGRLQVENLQRPFEDDRGGITTVAMDRQASNRRVLLQFDGTNWQKRIVEDAILRQAWPGWDQSVWGYTINSLLRFEREPEGSFHRHLIWLGQYSDVATDTNGVFWLGTSEGLVRCAPYLWRTPAALDGVGSLAHAALEEADGTLWFATADLLLFLREGRWQRVKWPEGFEADFQPTDALYPLREGKLAVAANGRALVFDPASGRFRFVAHPTRQFVRLIGPHKDRSVWAQTSAGNPASGEVCRLEIFDGENFLPGIEAPPDGSLNGDLFFAHETQNGDLWIGGTGGVSAFRGGRWQTFDPAQGWIGGRALCLLEWPDGKLWCGGADKIWEFDGKRWSIQRGGLGRVSNLIRARDGKIWAATSSGLYSYADGSWVANGVEEGLPSEAVSEVCEDRAGRIWAGTARGVSRHHPNADPHPPRTLPPRVDYGRQPSSESPVTLEFHAIDKWRYTPAERLLFSYRFDEGQWSPYTNALTQSFANLRAGKHRVEVRAMDRNRNPDPLFSFVEFSVVVPWYREPRVMGSLTVGLVLVLFFAGLAVNRHLQLIRSYAEVEKIVAQRTRELERANQELLQSQKMKALGTLAAGIAHDFNNILSIIKGSAQIIEGHLEDKEKIRTRVNRIKTVVEQGSGIVKSMLGLSQITEKNLVWCDLREMVDDTLKLLGDRFLQEVSVRVEAGPSMPRVPGVREMIQQMLLNLILNGADAMMGRGELAVRFEMRLELPAGLALAPAIAPSYVVVAVQDSGSGIAPEVLPRIFEPFFTTKAFSTRRGTGLGLSMVYELAKQMGYGLSVETMEGQGSTFSIFFPVRQPPETPDTAPAERSEQLH